MSIDYGARLRALADHLETVPDSEYSYVRSPITVSFEGPQGGACALAHGFLAGIIPDDLRISGLWDPNQASEWLGFPSFYAMVARLVGREDSDWVGSGALFTREKAIRNLRSYADAHYPLTPKHSGIPSSVLRLFEQEEAA